MAQAKMDYIILPSNKEVKAYWGIKHSFEVREKEDILNDFVFSMTANPGGELWQKLGGMEKPCVPVKRYRGQTDGDVRVLSIKLRRSSEMFLKEYKKEDQDDRISFDKKDIGYRYTPVLVACSPNQDGLHHWTRIALEQKIIYGRDEALIKEWLYTTVYARILEKIYELRQQADTYDQLAHQHNLGIIKGLTNAVTDEEAVKAYKKMVRDLKKQEHEQERIRQQEADDARRNAFYGD